MKAFRKRWALCISMLLCAPIAYTAESAAIEAKDTYTVNFNNISMIELIRFTSKITNLNFIFEDADLQFSVTVVSEEPVSPKSVMAAVSQVLRMHDLMLLEQDGNVLITKSTKVNQIPTIVSADLLHSKADNAAL